MDEQKPNDSVPAPKPVEYMDGIPVGRFYRRICWWPLSGGGYFLHDPEVPTRTATAGGFAP